MDDPETTADPCRTLEELLSRDVNFAQERVARRLEELDAFSRLNSIAAEEKIRLERYASAGLEAAQAELSEASRLFSMYANEGAVPVWIDISRLG